MPGLTRAQLIAQSRLPFLRNAKLWELDEEVWAARFDGRISGTQWRSKITKLHREMMAEALTKTENEGKL